MFDCKNHTKRITVIQLCVNRDLCRIKVKGVETSMTKRIICVVVSSELQDSGLAAKRDLRFNNLLSGAIKIIQKQKKISYSRYSFNGQID